MTRVLEHHKRHFTNYVMAGALLGGAIPVAITGSYIRQYKDELDGECLLGGVYGTLAGVGIGAFCGALAPVSIPLFGVGVAAYCYTTSRENTITVRINKF